MPTQSDAGFLGQYGLPSGTLEDYAAAKDRAHIKEIVSAPDSSGKAPSSTTQGFRGLGVALGRKFFGQEGPKPTEQEKRYFSVVEGAQNRFAKLREESPELWKQMSADDKAQTYLQYVADAAFEQNMPEVGAQAMRDYADRRRLTARQDREFEQLGYQTKEAAAQATSATRTAGQAGDLITLERGTDRPRTIERDDRPAILRAIREGWNPVGYPQTQRVANLYDDNMMKELGRADVEWYTQKMLDADEAFDRSRVANAFLREIESARGEGGFKTGFAAPLRMGLGVGLEFFNMPVPDIIGDPRAAQRMDAMSSQLALKLADHMSRITNMSLELVKQSVPNLSRTLTGNQLIAEMLVLAEEHAQARAAFLESFRGEHGSLKAPDGTTARRALQRWEREVGLEEQVAQMEERIRREDRAIRRSGVSWDDVVEATNQVASGVHIDRSAGTLPVGVPSGSQLIGRTPDGKDVYQLPDGTKAVYEGQ